MTGEPGTDHSPQSSPSLAGLRVAALESRMSDQTAILIERAGGVAVRAPSMRELPLDNQHQALQFAEHLLSDQLDVVIFLTGVGAKHLAEAIETKYPAEVWKAALAKTTIVARGPKPLTVLRGWGLKVAVQVPEPNTWRDVLESLDQKLPVQGKRIAIQEYGQTNPELIAGLEERDAKSIELVAVYRWALPEDLGPLKAAISGLIDGQIGVLAVTSAQQVKHMLQVAESEGLAKPLIDALNHHVIVASIGPVATETLIESGIRPDLEPEHPKLGPLVQTLAKTWKSLGKIQDDRPFGTWLPQTS
jgi:uroporphyrinogen-III synthase